MPFKDTLILPEHIKSILMDIKVKGVSNLKEAEYLAQSCVDSSKSLKSRIWEEKKLKLGFKIVDSSLNDLKDKTFNLIKGKFKLRGNSCLWE